MRQETRKALNQTADLAARALHFLIADGKLALRDVTAALSRRKQLIKELRNRFTALETEGVAGRAKAQKAAPRKASGRRPRKAAVRAKAGARSAAKAAVAKKRTVARSARKKASAPKTTVSSKPTPRPRTVTAKTKKPVQLAVTAPAAEPTPRPVADTESATQTAAPARKTTTRKLPKVANPELEGRGPGPRDSNQI